MSAYINPLGVEMTQYLELLEKAGRYIRGIEGLFRELDKYIPASIQKDKALSEDVLFSWDNSLTCSPVTRKRKYTELRGFMRFLQSVGIKCRIPEIPRAQASSYAPYIFDEYEWTRIVHEADNLSASLKQIGTDMPIVFPMIIRLLYTCGLRVSEALFLRVDDIDFDLECLTIHHAKRRRQRIVPMKKSTSDLLMKYCTRRGLLSKSGEYIFSCSNEKPPSKCWVQRWFAITLENSEIKQTRANPGNRGICPHCIRHTFAYRSFHASADTFENTVPFLSTYMGHENIMETDRYLRFSYELYTDAHDRISEYTGALFPEVDA